MMTFFDESYKRAIAEGASPTGAVATAIGETDERVNELLAEVEALKTQRDALVEACEDIHKALSDNDDMLTTVEWVRDLVELTLGRKP